MQRPERRSSKRASKRTSSLILSPSQISTYQHCGERWRLRYIERMHEPTNPAMIRGSAVHASIASNMQAKKDGEEIPLDVLKDIAADSVRGGFQSEVMFDGDELEKGFDATRSETVDTAVDLSTLHAKSVAPKIEPVTIEHSVDIKIDGLPTIRSVLDLTDKQDLIIDTKTSKRSPQADAADGSMQLTQYHITFLAENKRPPSAMVLDHLIHTKTQGSFHVRQLTSRTSAAIASYLKRVETVADAMQKGIAVPAEQGSWKCSARYCGFYGNVCKYTRE